MSVRGSFGRGTVARKGLWIISASLFLPQAATAQNAGDSPTTAVWKWEHANPRNKQIRMSFVRGSVRVIRRPGPVRIHITRIASQGHAAAASITVAETDHSFDLVDRYPPATSFPHDECLPPTHERGDFFHTIVRLETVVEASPSTSVQVRLMDGEVQGAEPFE